MKKLFFLGLLALLFVACNKNQKAVKKLDGEWNAVSYVVTYDGMSEDYLVTEGFGFTIKFDNCKLKKDNFCTSTWTQTYPGEAPYVMLVDYRVTSEGESLEFRDPEYPSELIVMTIVELTNDKLVFTLDDGDGDLTTITMER